MGKENEIDVMSSRLARAMDAQGLNSAQLAEMVGITRSAMSLFTRGKRRPGRAVLAKLANQLSVTTDYLLGSTDDVNIAELMENPRISKLVRDFIALADRDQTRVLEIIDLIGKTGAKEDGASGSETSPDTPHDGTD